MQISDRFPNEEIIGGGAVRIFGPVARRLPSIEAWNDPGLWRDAFADLADGPPFVAENFLGEQYRIVDEAVFCWNPETGEQEPTGMTFGDWLARVRSDPGSEVPTWLLDDWQAAHGPLSPGDHLAPLVPFVLGGGYEVENLHATPGVADLRWRAQLAVQLQDLPDGTDVRLHVKREP